MSISVCLKITLLTLATAMALFYFTVTPANAQSELLTPVAAPYVLAIAGMGFIAGYSAAPHLVRVWRDKQRKENR
jgi:hypothetical protein